jgi:uncharacterized protein (TIGR02757 family)
MRQADIQEFLDRKVDQYNNPSFIPDDPISIPHRYTRKQDIEIAGFFAAIFAWGNRKTIIRKAGELMERMDNAPYQFILEHRERDLRKFADFKHRTFRSTDLYYFLAFLQFHYRKHDSLETAFSQWMTEGETTVEAGLDGFYQYFFSLKNNPPRTRKHIASPQKKSSCKRLNMFLRWMIRRDDRQVDFGLWNRINRSQLICPIDLHVARVARKFGLLQRSQTDWLAALELTSALRDWDRNDPVKYDFALFSLGALEKY